MRVAMVSEHASPLAAIGGEDAGGQNVHVAALSKALVTAGHDVTVYTRRDSTTLPNRVMTSDGYVVEHVPAGPPTDIPKDQLLKYMPELGRGLARRWNLDQPDVVHSHFWMSGLATMRAVRAVQIPVVHTFHALGSVKRQHQGAKDTSPRSRIAQERMLCSSVDAVVATCTDEVAELTKLGLNPDRATVIPCGVDTDTFRPRPVRNSKQRRPFVLVVGRLVPRKGVEDVIRAMCHVRNADLVIAGGPDAEYLSADPEVKRLQAIARNAGVAGRVQFLGAVDRMVLPELMARAELVVSAPWYEPFGIVPLEAMASGRAFVGTAVGGLLDSVVHGVTGDLVPARRPDALGRVLNELLADPSRRASYGSMGRARAVSRYRWPRIGAETERVYASVLARVSSETEVAR
ncbi:MAG: glycosyltransferase [Actinomycetes bacterium]